MRAVHANARSQINPTVPPLLVAYLLLKQVKVWEARVAHVKELLPQRIFLLDIIFIEVLTRR